MAQNCTQILRSDELLLVEQTHHPQQDPEDILLTAGGFFYAIIYLKIATGQQFYYIQKHPVPFRTK
jgi:hypothetical protein